jgi:hypothetical protein
MEHTTWEGWLASRPESVQKLAAEFPPLTTIEVNRVKHYVFAYDENDGLIVSPVDSRENYALAFASRRTVCAAHVRDGSVKLLSKSVYVGGSYREPE